jgi:hypothetical protein
MKFILKFRIPLDKGNEQIKSPEFGHKMNQIFTDMKAEAVYFSVIDGQRGGFAVVDMADASMMPLIAEPLFLWANADIEWLPVMLPGDLGKADPDIRTAVKKWG